MIKKIALLVFVFLGLASVLYAEDFDPLSFKDDTDSASVIPDICKKQITTEGNLRVGAVNFTNQSKDKIRVPEAWGWWKDLEVNLPEVVTDHIISELVAVGGARVYTRTELNKLMEEQKFQISGLTDDKTLVGFGKLVGLQYIITGSINNIGFTTGAMALLTGSRPQIEVQLSVRMINVETGEIVLSKGVVGKHILEASDYVGVVSGIKKAITKSLEDTRPEFSKLFTVRGYILQTKKGEEGVKAALINIGEKHGLKTGMKMHIHYFQEVKDPFTGQSICNILRLPVEGEVTNQIQENNAWVLIKGDAGKIIHVHPGCIVERRPSQGQGFFQKLGM